ncbi:MAG: pectin esterase [Clostridia bacterium]|nr:pectin esterase [Clostridia bacterium]
MKILHLTPSDSLETVINGLTEPAEIYLANGVYRQKTEIKANNVTIIGESRGKTVITYGDYAKKIHKDGKEYNTFRTYTLCITGENVKLRNLTVENSNTNPQKVGQCVALSVNCKNFYAENVCLKSTQDTLFLAPFPDDLVVRYMDFIPQNQLCMEGAGVHLFKNCEISGTVDFIFGCAEAYFYECDIISLADERKTGFIAAPAHSLKQERGFYFVNCNISANGADKASNYLARPWRDFGKCDFINCKTDGHINGQLFDKWNDSERDRTARFSYYGLDCAFTPSPVGWSKALTKDEADKIINACKAKFTAE